MNESRSSRKKLSSFFSTPEKNCERWRERELYSSRRSRKEELFGFVCVNWWIPKSCKISCWWPHQSKPTNGSFSALRNDETRCSKYPGLFIHLRWQRSAFPEEIIPVGLKLKPPNFFHVSTRFRTVGNSRSRITIRHLLYSLRRGPLVFLAFWKKRNKIQGNNHISYQLLKTPVNWQAKFIGYKNKVRAQGL